MSKTKAKKISVVRRRGEKFRCKDIGFDFSKFKWICEKASSKFKMIYIAYDLSRNSTKSRNQSW